LTYCHEEIDWFRNIWRSRQGPWPYLRHWLALVLPVEILMFIFNRYLPIIYVGVALLFTGGFLLRLLKVYPGKPEPLILDLSGILIAIIYGLTAQAVGLSPWRFLLIITSSAIILPHIFYILNTFKLE